MACNGLKKGSFHLFVHPIWCRIIFATTHFWPIFDSFSVATKLIFKAFWDFRGSNTGHHKVKTRQKHLFWHSMWSRIMFEKKVLHVVALVDPCWHPPLWATSCSLPHPFGPK